MKMTAGILLIFCLFRCVVEASDEAAVARIKQLYAQTAAAIALAQKGEAGGLYGNELVVNSCGGSWRAVGNYSKKVVFWYSDQPDFFAAAGKEAKAALAKVEVCETAAAHPVDAWLAKFYGGLDGSMYANMHAADRVELVRRRAMELASFLGVLEQK